MTECPQCGTMNEDDIKNCKSCRVNMYWAHQHYSELASLREANACQFAHKALRSWSKPVNISMMARLRPGCAPPLRNLVSKVQAKKSALQLNRVARFINWLVLSGTRQKFCSREKEVCVGHPGLLHSVPLRPYDSRE